MDDVSNDKSNMQNVEFLVWLSSKLLNSELSIALKKN